MLLTIVSRVMTASTTAGDNGSMAGDNEKVGDGAGADVGGTDDDRVKATTTLVGTVSTGTSASGGTRHLDSDEQPARSTTSRATLARSERVRG